MDGESLNLVDLVEEVSRSFNELSMLQADFSKKVDLNFEESIGLKQQLRGMGEELNKVIQDRDFQAAEKKKLEKAAYELRVQLEHTSSLLANKESDTKAASAEFELTILQIHQSLKDTQQQVSELKKQLEEKGFELKKVSRELDARAKEKGEASEDAELMLLQLHQVQEELERYFLESRSKHDLLSQHRAQSLMMRKTIAKLAAGKS